MLDIGGTITCRIFQYEAGFFQIYIPAKLLGIEPGNIMIRNDSYFNPTLKDSPWYIKLYSNSAWKKNRHKRKYRKVNHIPERVLSNSSYYCEAVKIHEDDTESGKWFEQEIKASIILPIMKEKSKIPNGLIYVDEYWKT